MPATERIAVSAAPPPDDSGSVGSASESNEDARKRLELEKLQLETDAARAAKGLAAEKMRLDIEQVKKGDVRSAISSFASIFLGLATMFLGISGFFLNTTINHAAERQRAFENYTKLTDEFSKGGSARLGAIVGFRPFLKPPSDRTEQTIELLASDLLDERDAVARRAIVDDLIFTGMPAFDRVRQINRATRENLREAALGYLLDRYLPHVDAQKAAELIAARELRERSARDLEGAVDDYEPEATATVRDLHAQFLRNLLLWDVSADDAGAEINGRALHVARRLAPNSPQHWIRRYDAQTAAFLASAAVLSTLLSQKGADLRNLDASGIAVYDLDWTNADLEGIQVYDASLHGVANGADLTNAALNHTDFFLDLHRSSARSTSLCGASLDGAMLFLPMQTNGDKTTVTREELPNLTATDWWNIAGVRNGTAGTYTGEFARATLDAAFPRLDNEELTTKPADEKKRRCMASAYTQKGSASPDPLLLRQ